MSAERINGVKMHLDRLTDDELLNVLGHAQARAEQYAAEADHLMGSAVMRGLVELETAVEDPHQLTLTIEGEQS